MKTDKVEKAIFLPPGPPVEGSSGVTTVTNQCLQWFRHFWRHDPAVAGSRLGKFLLRQKHYVGQGVWGNVCKGCHGVTAPIFRGCFGRVLRRDLRFSASFRLSTTRAKL